MTARRSRLVLAVLAAGALLAGCTGAGGNDAPDTPDANGLAVNSITGTTYYLSADGDDSADGTASSHAWRTLARASAARLAPGDGVLLRSGDTFDGTLQLSADDAGDPAHPVVVASTGPSPAQITSSTGAGIYVQNTGGVHIANLDLSSAAPSITAAGITVFSDQTRTSPYLGISIESVDVSGFADGISIGAAAINSGFGNVTIRNSATHDNVRNGVNIYGPRLQLAAPGYANRNVVVDGVRSFANHGDPKDLGNNTGSGIIVGSTDGAVVSNSTSSENGKFANASRGPGGIWAYDANNVRFERNLSFGNLTGTGTADGNGFEFDINVTNSLIQYNLSYGNDGAGYLICNCEDGVDGSVANNVLRYNISSNDVRRREFYGGIMVVSSDRLSPTQGLRDLQIYNNTVVMSAQAEGAPAVLRMYGAVQDVTVANNIFVTNGGSPFVDIEAGTVGGVQLVGNAYQSLDNGPRWQWAGLEYSSLATWLAASGQESLAGQPAALTAQLVLPDPLAVPAARTAADLPGVPGLIPPLASPANSGGVDLASMGIDRGPDTYFGASHPCLRPGVGAAC